MKEQIEEIKDCIDSVYGCDCAYYGVEGMAIAQAIYNAGYRKQREKYLIKENGDILPLTHHSEWISVDDRLPERNGRYITHCKIEGKSLVCVLYYCKVGGFNEGTVTHWMPLPEPPEMKGSE